MTVDDTNCYSAPRHFFARLGPLTLWPLSKLVLLALFSDQGPDGRVLIGTNRLANSLGVERVSIQNVLRKLADRGLIIKLSSSLEGSTYSLEPLLKVLASKEVR